MGAPTWPKLPDLIEGLLDGAHGFGLFQALRILEHEWGARGELGAGLDRWLRLRPSPELGFPAADLRGCELDGEGCLTLRVNALGLYGVDAPLPHYFLERACGDQPGAEALRAFLDMFGHRLYVLLYHAWKLGQDFRGGYGDAVAAVAGVLDREDDAASAHAAVFSRRVRSAAGLTELVREALGGLAVRVRDRQIRWLDLEPQALGDGPGLAVGAAVLGGRLQVAGGRIVIEIGPLAWDRARTLAPGQPQGKALAGLIRRYLEGRADFDLVLRVLPAGAAAPALGETGPRLGWSSWLGEGEDEFRVRIRGEQLQEGGAPVTTGSRPGHLP